MIANWDNSRPDEGVLVRVFGVGRDEERGPRKAREPVERPTNYFAPIPVWDPVEGRAIFPSVPQASASDAERESEARIAERVRAASPVMLAGKTKRPAQRRAGKRKEERKRKEESSRDGLMELSDGEVFDLEAFQRDLERRKLNLPEFRGMLRTGGFKTLHLVAQGPEFVIQVEPLQKPAKMLGIPEQGRLTLVTINDRENHRFPNPTTALGLLKRMGVKRVEIDIESWRPDLPTQRERRRPDMAERLRFAHEYAGGSKSKG